MARLRNHETYGKSIKCVTVTPYGKGNGPSFTVHLFDTGVKTDNKTVCAYELWQRDLDTKRYRLLEGEGVELDSPTEDKSVVTLLDMLSSASVNSDDPKVTEYYDQHNSNVVKAAKDRFLPKRAVVAETTPVSEADLMVETVETVSSVEDVVEDAEVAPAVDVVSEVTV